MPLNLSLSSIFSWLEWDYAFWQNITVMMLCPSQCILLGCVHTANSSPLPGIWPLKPEPQLPTLTQPGRVSRQASRAGECWSAPILCVGISPLCPLHPCCCALLRDSEASPPTPPSPPVKGLPGVWKLFLLHSSLPEVQVPSLFFCLCFFCFLLPYPGTWGVSCLLGSLRSSASIQ